MKTQRITAGTYRITTANGVQFICQKRTTDWGTSWHLFCTGDEYKTSDCNWCEAFDTLGDAKYFAPDYEN